MARAVKCGMLDLVPLCVLLVCAGCSTDRHDLLLASTTSTEDSGLLDVLLPAFMEARPGVTVKVTAVGTGQALELGRRRDADVLLVHAPAAEAEFMVGGHGTGRCDVMYNDFVVVGPPSDPAGVSGLSDAVVAFQRIADGGATFISRGDDSGTHRKEQSLWEVSGREPGGGWYLEVGQGMAESLRMAVERRGYALTDRATYLDQIGEGELAVLVQGDSRLFNQYGVIPVVGARHPELARAFALWITGEEGQALIAGYGADRFGKPLFIPNAEGCELPTARNPPTTGPAAGRRATTWAAPSSCSRASTVVAPGR